MEKKFKPFDKVLVKSHYDHCWKPDFFCYKIEGKGIQTIVGFYNEENILPYEGNEHLVGTSDEPDEEVRLEEGEWLMAKTDNNNWVLAQYKEHSELPWNNIEVVFINKNHVYVDYVVRFSDFNPNDMEATKAKILCVKNGRIVRYKG